VDISDLHSVHIYLTCCGHLRLPTINATNVLTL
jgi:hypothetical protein